MWNTSKRAAAEPVKKGFFGDLTTTQSQVLQDVKDWLTEERLETNGQWDDHDLLRFCRARKFVLADVKTMLSKALKARKEGQVDTILDDFVFSELDTVKGLFPHGYHGMDKIGRPIYIEKMGLLDSEKLYAATTV